MVQPAIAPRFGSAPAMVDEVDPNWNREAEHPLQSNLTVQEQLSPPEPDSAINPAQEPYSTSITSPLPSQSLHSTSILSKSSSRQPVFSAANSSASTQAIVEEPAQRASLEPFRVLQPRQQVLVETHPTLAITQPKSELQNTPEIVSKHSGVQPITPSNRSDRLIESEQVPFAQPTQPAAQVDLRSAVPSPPFPPVSAEPTVVPPTIRVSIGRVEVRAIMPAPPAPKVAPVRPHPTVSLNDYLKQRSNKP